MRDDVVDLLACPHCGRGLTADGGALRCAARHAFDLARQGYVTLLPGGVRPAGGDTAAMVEARAAFLARGHLAPLTEAVTDTAELALAGGPAGGIVDLGAGTGHQLAHLLERLPGRAGVALDVSRPAVRRAARAHRRAGAVLCDVWRPLPLRTGAAALVLDVFAPRNGGEISRVLDPRGALVVASAAPDHLAELVEPLGLLTVDEDKPRRIEAALGPQLERAGAARCDFTLELAAADVLRLVEMGPSAWHLDPAVLRRRVAALPAPVQVRASVEVATYRPRDRQAGESPRHPGGG